MKKISISGLIITVMLLFTLTSQTMAQQIKGVSSAEFNRDFYHLLSDNKTPIIDGRSSEMYKQGHIKNAVNIDADSENLEQMLKQYKEEPRLIVYCTTTRRVEKIIEELGGFYDGEVIYITDGIRGWKDNGFVVVSELTEQEE